MLGCLLVGCVHFAAAIMTTLPGYEVSWTVNDTDIEFTLNVNTDGWIGLGISGGSGMKGMDVVRIDGSGNIEDGFALAKQEPTKDCQQDWTLVNRTVAEGITTAVIKRKLVTGDNQDRPFVNDGQFHTLLVAHGAPGAQTFGYHSTKRSTVHVNIFGEQPSLAGLKADKDIETFEIAATNWRIPDNGNMDSITSYINVCTDIPNSDSHIVAWEPKITPGNEKHIHHMVVYASPIHCTPGKTDGEGGDSLEQTGELVSLWLYGPGTGPWLFPTDIGLPVGGKVKSFIVNIHYDNPQKMSGLVDSSGVIAHYTTVKRKYDMGILWVGDPKIIFSRLQQPVPLEDFPEHPLSKYSFVCPSSYFKHADVENKITIIGSALHMHFSGEYIKTELLDWMGKPKATWEVDFYDGAYQAMLDVPSKPSIDAGDYIRTTCAFDAFNKFNGRQRKWGLGANDEMCMDWIYFYSTDPTVVQKVENTSSGTCGSGLHGSWIRTSGTRSRTDLGVRFGDPPQNKDAQCNNVNSEQLEATHKLFNVTSTGTTMNVAMLGPDDAQTMILCLHGFPSASGMWLPEFGPELIRLLSDDESIGQGGVRLLAPDLRGVNRTVPKYQCPEVNCTEYTPKTIGNEVAELLKEHFAGKKFHVVAHDWGGIVAFRLAIFHPDLVASVSSANMVHPSVFTQFLKHDAKQQAASKYTDDLVDSDVSYPYWKPNATSPGFGASMLILLPEGEDYYMREAWLFEDSLKHHMYWYRGSNGLQNLDEDVTEDNIKLQMPVLMLWGMDDEYVLSRQLCCMKSVAPDLTVKLLHDVDHWVVERTWAQAAKAVSAFILKKNVGDRCSQMNDVCTTESQAVCEQLPLVQDHGCDTTGYRTDAEVDAEKRCQICAAGGELQPNNLAGEDDGKSYSCKDAHDYITADDAEMTCKNAQKIWATHCCFQQDLDPSEVFTVNSDTNYACQSGMHITTAEKCMQAARFLLVTYGGPHHLNYAVGGCIKYDGDSTEHHGVYFNTHPGVSPGREDHHAVCLAKMTSEKIQGSLKLTVEPSDVTTYKTDDKIKTAFQKVIAASITGVSYDMVRITGIVSVDGRLLGEQARRLASNVEVQYEVTVPEGVLADTVISQLTGTSAATMTSALTTEFKNQGLSVGPSTVTEISAPTKAQADATTTVTKIGVSTPAEVSRTARSASLLPFWPALCAALVTRLIHKWTTL